MAGGDHDAAVEPLRPGHVGDGRRGGDVEQVSVRAGGHQPGGQRVLKHIAAAAGILADDHADGTFVPGAALRFAAVPAQEAAHLIGVVRRQRYVGLPAEAVCSEISAHVTVSLLLLGHNVPRRFENTVRRHRAPDGAEGIDVGVPPNDRAGVQHAVAADLHVVAQHRAYLLPARVHALSAADADHVGLVGLDVGGDRTRAHVGLVAQDAVAHVVIMGRLHAVKEDDVLQLHGVAHHAARAHQGAAPDERAVAHLRVRADDARPAQIGRGRDLGGLMYPHVRGGAFVVRAQRRAEGQDQVGDAGQRLPGIGEAGEIVPRQRVVQVKQVLNGIHDFPPAALRVIVREALR